MHSERMHGHLLWRDCAPESSFMHASNVRRVHLVLACSCNLTQQHSAHGLQRSRAVIGSRRCSRGLIGPLTHPNLARCFAAAACSLRTARAQIFSSDAVQSSGGVYWMFYAGSCFEEAPAPAGLHGLSAGAPTEGLRCASCVTGRLSALQQNATMEASCRGAWDGQSKWQLGKEYSLT